MTDVKIKKKAPFIKHPDSIHNIMLDVFIAIAPTVIWSVYSYGARAVSIILVSVVTAITTETAFEFIMKKSYTIVDLTAVLTGVMIAMCLPVTVPLYVPAIGAFFAVGIVKCLFGGLGGNFLNPALAGVVFIKVCMPEVFDIYLTPGTNTLTNVTPLDSLKEGMLPNESIYDILVGNTAGALGEGSAILIVAGGIYLLVRGIIGWQIPTAYIGCAAALMLAFPQNVNGISFVITEIISGGLLFGAFFMATDPVTSPMMNTGKIIYGAICGGMTVLLRYYGAEADGTAYAILFANLFVGVIDRVTFPKRFGGNNIAEAKADAKAEAKADAEIVTDGTEAKS